MRDPKRIEQITMALFNYWMKYPDLRLGQLLVNLHHHGRKHTQSQADIFNTEDDEWLEWLLKFYL